VKSSSTRAIHFAPMQKKTNTFSFHFEIRRDGKQLIQAEAWPDAVVKQWIDELIVPLLADRVMAENIRSMPTSPSLPSAKNNFDHQKLLVTKKEAAKMLSVSVRTIDTLVAQKQLTVRRIGRRVLIPLGALRAFVRKDHSLP
jgi:excisionase family DNA binding protein